MAGRGGRGQGRIAPTRMGEMNDGEDFGDRPAFGNSGGGGGQPKTNVNRFSGINSNANPNPFQNRRSLGGAPPAAPNSSVTFGRGGGLGGGFANTPQGSPLQNSFNAANSDRPLPIWSQRSGSSNSSLLTSNPEANVENSAQTEGRDEANDEVSNTAADSISEQHRTTEPMNGNNDMLEPESEPVENGELHENSNENASSTVPPPQATNAADDGNDWFDDEEPTGGPTHVLQPNVQSEMDEGQSAGHGVGGFLSRPPRGIGSFAGRGRGGADRGQGLGGGRGTFASRDGNRGGRGRAGFADRGAGGGRGGGFGDRGGRGAAFGDRGGRGGGTFGDRGGLRGGRGGGFGRGGRGGGVGTPGTGANSSDFNDTQRPYAGMFSNRSGQEQRPVDERQQALPFFDRPPRRQFASEEERVREASHVPVNRPLEELYEEDKLVADSYRHITDDDDDVHVSGVEQNQAPTAVIGNWEEADFEPKLLQNIGASQYVLPRKIQSYSIPLIKEGVDLKGQAETGSGKSAAFLLPLIDKIMKLKKSGQYKSHRDKPYVLVIEPTRELTIQLWEQAQKLANGCDVSVARAYGKYRLRDNLREISIGCDILIGTTGRLLHLFKEDWVQRDSIKVLVLDEADELLEDMSNRELRYLEQTNGFPKKEDRQTILFSATFPQEIQLWANEWVRDTAVFVTNDKPKSANAKVRQNFKMLSGLLKEQELLKILREEAIQTPSEQEDQEINLPRTMVFVRTKRQADVLAIFLCGNKIKATTINSDRPQALREDSLLKFRKGFFQVLVSTDVCSRGLDIKELDHIINYDLPDDICTYIHRIGRTGRLKEGLATSFFDPSLPSDMDLAKELVRVETETEQEPPDFLVKAAEGKLEWTPPSARNFFDTVVESDEQTTQAPVNPTQSETNQSGETETTRHEPSNALLVDLSDDDDDIITTPVNETIGTESTIQQNGANANNISLNFHVPLAASGDRPVRDDIEWD